MTVGTEDLNTYIRVNEPLTGIAQQRPLNLLILIMVLEFFPQDILIILIVLG